MPVPIVLLPGIMGSRLFFPSSGRFWDPDDYWRMGRWAPIRPFRSDDDNRVQLHAREPAGVVVDTADVNAEERDRGWSTVVWSFYGGLLRVLKNEVATSSGVYAVGYDWRQDIGWLGEYAAEKIDRIRETAGVDKVIVVTHSMGGLVIRAAMIVRPDLRAKLTAVVHVCQPSVGAVILYRRLFTGLIRPYDGGGGIADRAFRLLLGNTRQGFLGKLGNTRQGFLGNMSGLPGAMQLLPSRYFPRAADGGPWHPGLDQFPHEALYPDRASPPGLVPDYLELAAEVVDDLRERVTDVAWFHQLLGDPRNPLHPESWLIYGTGRTTETHIEFGVGGPVPGTELLGDETVPALSATALSLPEARMIRAPGVVHAEACVEPLVQQQVVEILTGYG